MTRCPYCYSPFPKTRYTSKDGEPCSDKFHDMIKLVDFKIAENRLINQTTAIDVVREELLSRGVPVTKVWWGGFAEVSEGVLIQSSNHFQWYGPSDFFLQTGATYTPTTTTATTTIPIITNNIFNPFLYPYDVPSIQKSEKKEIPAPEPEKTYEEPKRAIKLRKD